MEFPAFARPALVLLATTFMAGCASVSPGDLPATGNDDTADRGPMYIVQPGDRLSDIALAHTGRIDTWQIIAAFNGIDDPRTLQPGFELEIPPHLIKPAPERTAARTPAPAATTPARVVVSAVSTNRRFDMTPITDNGDATAVDSAAPTAAPSTGLAASERYVTVVGSYYPKGIYAQPAIYSELLHRVAPGSQFALSGQIEDWYEIALDDGEPGYIRVVDARVYDGALPTDDVRR